MGETGQTEQMLAWLEWQAAMGADEATGETPVDRFALAPPAAPAPAAPARKPPLPPRQPAFQPPPVTAPRPAAAKAQDSAAVDARKIAAACNSLEDIVAALEKFDACPLKRTATRLCLYDGNPKAPVMLIGEAPGRDEDIQGKPFVGRSGRLLDKMLAQIGLSRDAQNPQDSVFISNAVFWRPPGNRKPTEAESTMCMPFLKRLIDLTGPQLIVCLGATPSQRLTGQTQGIIRLRGRWFSLASDDREIPVLATYHPAFLLRTPQQKRQAWADMVQLRKRLDELAGQDT